MIQRILLLTLIIITSSCGGDSDTAPTSMPTDPVISNLNEIDMTGIWLSKSKIIYTSKNNGRVLETTTRTFQIYIEDTVNGIRDITCPLWVIDPGIIIHTGNKTNFEYYPDDVTTEPYVLESGILVQKYETDVVWGDEDAIKSNYNTLVYLESTKNVYTEGVIILSETIDVNQAAEICTLHVKQKFLSFNETNTFSFFIPYGSGDLDYLEIAISLVGNPVAERYNLGDSYYETGFRKIYISSITPEFSNLAGGSLVFGESGWIDILSIGKKNFESEFSIMSEENDIYTGYINVNISHLVQ